MAITINNSSSSLSVSQLVHSQKSLASSLEKVASERRDEAVADAGGMAVADSLLSQARGTGQALRKANDAISMAQVADSALSQSTALVHSIRQKAVQAADADQTAEARQALQSDIDNSLTQLDKIAQETVYNGQQLLSGTFTGKEVQSVAKSGETIKLSIATATTNKLANLSEVSVLNQESAQGAIKVADEALGQINAFRADLDSTRNQLAATINNLAATGTNLLAAASTPADADLAEEAINFTTMKVLTEAKSLALAQTKNMNKQNVLSLLQG